MRHKHFLLLLLCAMMSATTALAGWSKVWEQPAVDYNKWGNQIVITRVEMNERQTVVSFHCWHSPLDQIGFDKNTVLRAGGKDYAALSSTVLTLGEGFTMPESGNMDFTITFAPFDAEVTDFDCVFPQFFTIKNVRDRHVPKADLCDTYWRNAATGDWLIGFAKDAVIYDTRLWDIVSRTEKKGAFDYTVRNGNEEVHICVGKEKKGRRSLRVGEAKAIPCERITSRFMPPYPVADNRPAVADNGYRMGDSVTIIGWYKDMNKEAWKEGREFSIDVQYLCLPDNSEYSTAIDSLGRFTLRIPVENTCRLRPDWARCRWELLLEPGETYFLLKDFATDQMLVMGRDARVQNEILTNEHCITYTYFCPAAYNYMPQTGLMDYVAKADSACRQELQRTASVPNLSERYRMYHRNSTLAELGQEIIQVGFYDRNLSDEFFRFVDEKVFKQLEGSYHLGYGAGSYFIGMYASRLKDHTAYSEADRPIMQEYNKRISELFRKIQAASTDEERKKIAEAYNKDKNYEELIAKASAIQQRRLEMIPTVEQDYKVFLHTLDSLGWNKLQRDIYLGQSLCERIDNQRTPLTPELLDFAKAEIELPLALDAVLSMHERYENISKQTLNTASLYSNDNVQGMSDGEQILRKILEPFRGKMVLIDVWGTWCGPCKAALAHSQEEYARLKPYDIVYLYLANGSSDEAWKNVIKEYNVQGAGVVHYNLPHDQQQAVENFLKVNSFPSYRLIDAEGRLLNVNADPRDLDALERVIKQITEKR